MSAVHWHDFDRTHGRDTALRLGVAVVLILAVYSAGAYLYLHLRQVDPGDTSPPAAVMIELAPLAVSQAAQDDNTPAPPMAFSPESVPDAPDIPTEDAPPPEPVVEQIVEKMPEVAPAPAETEVVLPKAEPEKKKEVKQPPKPVERPKKDAQPTRRKQAPATAAPPRSEAPRSETTRAPSAGASAERSAAIADWSSRLKGHIDRFKRPQSGHSGLANIQISLSGSGAVLSVSLTGSSGDEVLDREAVAMARRASPFPAPPSGQATSVRIPIRFSSR